MINPTAIISVKEGTSVQTPEGIEENVDKIAVWDWWVSESDPNTLRLHSNIGDVYIPVSSTEKIEKL